MKSIVNRIVLFLVIGTLTSMLALGKTTEKKVTFNQSVSVNGTIIQKGTYKVTFNDETGELTIKKGKNIVATAEARLEKTNLPYASGSYLRSESDDPTKVPTLVSISLKEGNLVAIQNSGPSARQ